MKLTITTAETIYSIIFSGWHSPDRTGTPEPDFDIFTNETVQIKYHAKNLEIQTTSDTILTNKTANMRKLQPNSFRQILRELEN